MRALARAILQWLHSGCFPYASVPPPPDLEPLVPSPATRFGPLLPHVAWSTLDRGGQALHGLLEELGPWGVLALLGLRRTIGTIPQLPPSPSRLVESFAMPHAPESTSRLSVGARALSKHWHRSAGGSAVWGGEPKGSDEAKNRMADAVLCRLLATAVWANAFDGVGDEGAIYEVRQVEGYGARWSADGRRFRGFVEPQAWDVQRRAKQQ